jgi:hypothetical protein
LYISVFFSKYFLPLFMSPSCLIQLTIRFHVRGTLLSTQTHLCLFLHRLSGFSVFLQPSFCERRCWHQTRDSSSQWTGTNDTGTTVNICSPWRFRCTP